MDVGFWRRQFGVGDAPGAQRFNALTPDDVVAWLQARDVRVDAVAFDYDSWENRVYGLQSSLGHVVVKVFRPGRWSAAALMDEVAFLDDMAAASMTVGEVLRPADGQAVGEAMGMVYLIYRHVPSTTDPTKNPEVLTEAQVRAWGAEIARLHQVGRQRDAPHRARFSPEIARSLAEVVVGHGLLPTDLHAAYQQRCERIAAVLEAHSEGVPLQRIHADNGVNNVLFTEQGPVVIDLDDFEVGPVVTDVMMATYGYQLQGHPPVPRATDAASLAAHFEGREPALRVFLEGYRTVAEFDEAQLQLIEPLHLLRGLYFDAWYCSRYHDPKFVEELADEGFPSRPWWQEQLTVYDQRLERLGW